MNVKNYRRTEAEAEAEDGRLRTIDADGDEDWNWMEWRLEMADAWSAGDSSTWRSYQYFFGGISTFGLAGNPATKRSMK